MAILTPSKTDVQTKFFNAPTILTKEVLVDLYINKKLSTWKIEKKYKYSRGAIYKKLKEYKIKTRNISESHILYKRHSFSGNNIERAYITGFAMGDLRVRKVGKKSETIKIGCGSTKKDQIKLIDNLFKKYGRVWRGNPDKRGVINIECFLDNSFDFLLKNKKLPASWVFKNKNYFSSFIAGFTDAEGCLSISNGRGYYSLGNYNKILLKKIRQFLVQNNISCSKICEHKIKNRPCFNKYRHNNNYWHFSIYEKRSLLIFLI